MSYIEIINKYNVENITPITFNLVGDEFEGFVDSVRVVHNSKYGDAKYLYMYPISDQKRVFIHAIRIGYGLSHVDWDSYKGRRVKIVLDKVAYSSEYKKEYNLYKVFLYED